MVLLPRGALPCALRFQSHEQRAQWLSALTSAGVTADAGALEDASAADGTTNPGAGARRASLPLLSLAPRQIEDTACWPAVLREAAQEQLARKRRTRDEGVLVWRTRGFAEYLTAYTGRLRRDQDGPSVLAHVLLSMQSGFDKIASAASTSTAEARPAQRPRPALCSAHS